MGERIWIVLASPWRARDAELIVILVAEEAMAGATTRAFWTECAAAFRDSPHVVFSLFRRPAPTLDGRIWQELFDAIRAAGARQIVSSPADTPIRGENVMYEAAVAVGSGSVFGNLLGRVPVYAGEWGLTDCAALPADPPAVSDLVFQTLYDFDDRGVSWTASDFAPDSLLRDTADYEPARHGPSGVDVDDRRPHRLRLPAQGSHRQRRRRPASPGQLLSIYVEQMGPAPDQFGRLDAGGRLPAQLGGTEVFFDGQRAPILFAGQYQLNVQAPPTLMPGKDTVLQVVYRGVPSNRLPLEVVSAAPELFHDIYTKNAIALNETGTLNGASNPAAAGSIVVLFSTGTGSTSPAGMSGQPAPSPHPLLTQPAEVFIGGREAELLFAGDVPLSLRVGLRSSQSAVLLQVK